MDSLISVIVPVYNVEKTLDRCMESILKQTYKNYEVILIDDGSTDSSGQICDKYAKRYPNVRVIHKQNEGLGPTRNRGIIEAKGEFIYHCDSDDWLRPELLAKSYEEINRTSADFVVFGYDIFTEQKGTLIEFDKICLGREILDTKEKIRRSFIEQFFNSFVMMSACNRFHRRSFLIENDLFFPDLRRSQDMAYSFMLFDKANRVSILNESFYCYEVVPGKYKGRAFTEMINIYCSIYELAKNKFEEWGLYDARTGAKLNDYICEHIANYSADALVNKYKKQWKENAKWLIKNKEITDKFHKYQNDKKSKYMKYFCFGIRIKSPLFLYLLSCIMKKKGKRR